MQKRERAARRMPAKGVTNGGKSFALGAFLVGKALCVLEAAGNLDIGGLSAVKLPTPCCSRPTHPALRADKEFSPRLMTRKVAHHIRGVEVGEKHALFMERST